MGSPLSTAPWVEVSGKLATADGRDFERVALPLLRAFWPSMAQPRGLRPLDQAGVDLIALGDGDTIECVVQCKGFFVSEGLEDKHVAPVIKSIEAFAKSSLKTADFVLLHNRDGRNRDAAHSIDEALGALVTSGKAARVRQWSREAFLTALAWRLRELIGERVREQSRLLLERMQQLFSFGGEFVANVPIGERELIIERGIGARVRELRKTRKAGNIANLLGSISGRDWTLLTGDFGAGKTTAALNAAALHPDRVVYVYGGSIEPRGDAGGTNTLMSRIVEALSVFADFGEEEQRLFHWLGGPLLRQLLSANDSRDVLIIDALDENKRLATPGEITVFASSLAELQCAIIMTTRESHFRATFGNFEHLFEQLSWKRGQNWSIGLVELQPWTDAEVKAFVAAAAAATPNNRALRDLAATIAASGTGGWDEDLLRHPLFLRMIIELEANGERAHPGMATTIGRWCRAKLKRDLQADRLLPIEVHDRDLFIDDMEQLMMDVAAATVVSEEGQVRLADSLSSDRVIEIAERILAVERLDLGRAIAATLLMPTAIRYQRTVPVRFTHRIFQEYYLARHIARSGLDPAAYPETVRRFVQEM